MGQLNRCLSNREVDGVSTGANNRDCVRDCVIGRNLAAETETREGCHTIHGICVTAADDDAVGARNRCGDSSG